MPRGQGNGLNRFAFALAAMFWAGLAGAGERRFTFLDDSPGVSSGGKELELWVTPRLGRVSPFTLIDNRLELALGLTDRLQTAVALNFAVLAEGSPKTLLVGGLSNEWKYNLLDQVADAVGLALLGKLTAASTTDFAAQELLVELQAILDKKLGGLFVAFNLTGEYAWIFAGTAVDRVLTLEPALGATYVFENGFGVGLESLVKTRFVNGASVGSALYAGPTLNWAGDFVWAAATFTPQVTGFSGGGLNLVTFERYVGRLILGLNF
jgi:hypothetical protein